MKISYVDPAGLDYEYYKQNNPDLAGMTEDQLRSHYMEYGRHENRSASAEQTRIKELQDAVARGEITVDRALDLLVDEDIDGQKSDDFGSLAEAPYESFTTYAGEAPTYTPTEDFKLSNYLMDPGYQFRLDEGNKAIERGQAKRGGLYSGAALKEAQRFAQDLATQEFGGAYGRYVDKYNRNVNDFNIDAGEYSKRRGEHNEDFGIGYQQAARDSDTLYSRLAGLTNAGMGATNTAVNANTQNATAQGNIYGQSGNAQAAAALNQGNMITSAVNTIGNTFGGGSSYAPAGPKITKPWQGLPPWQR